MTRDVPGLDGLLQDQAEGIARIPVSVCMAMVDDLAFSPATMMAQWVGVVFGGITLGLLWIAFQAWRRRT